MDDPKAPVAPKGWRIIRFFYDGRAPENFIKDGKGRSLEACRNIVRASQDSAAYGDEYSELAIEPMGGWKALKSDPLTAALLAYRGGDISLAVAALRIRTLFGKGEEAD
jgi:hypothetical protein